MDGSARVLSVSELNGHIKALLDSDPLLAGVAVKGELSNYKTYPSGHHYFTLKDAESSIRCVMFRSHAARLRFRPESGMRATAFGRVAVFPRDGAYQLYTEELSPDGLGDLHVAFEQLKEKLRREGLFDEASKKRLPRYPSSVAVITSSAGAAVRDIIRVLRARWPMARVIVLPVRVQGAEAPPEIAGALHYCNRHRVAELIITGRGGGSIEDLWAFNDERVARAIFASDIPVISAVGHEPDVTISDYVADLRAATPSNAAELACPDAGEIRESLAAYDIRNNQAMRKKLSELKRALAEVKSRRVMQSHMSYIDDRRMELEYSRERLLTVGERLLAARRGDFTRLCASLDAMSPLKVLKRGYSIAQSKNGPVIRSALSVSVGDELLIRLPDGELDCVVQDVRRDGNVGR